VAWVQTINPEVATGRLREVYDRIRQRKGNVPNIARLQSLRPETMNLGFSLYCQLMDDPTGISRRERALIATVVSKTNGCHY
jgi:alkylhydroperoxidase family enzyme